MQKLTGSIYRWDKLKSQDKEISLNPVVNTAIKFKWNKLPVEDKDRWNEKKATVYRRNTKCSDMGYLKIKQGKNLCHTLNN